MITYKSKKKGNAEREQYIESVVVDSSDIRESETKATKESSSQLKNRESMNETDVMSKKNKKISEKGY